MSSIRQVVAPSMKVCPSRASYTISSSSSPTRPPPSTRNTPKSPRSGIVPAFVTASRRAPWRPRTTPFDAVPDDPRPQLGELFRRVAPREHVEDVLERGAREVAEVPGAADELVQLVDRDLLVGADRDDLLSEHVERVARNLRLLDRPLPHPLRDDRALEQVGAELREDPALRDRVERVPGTTDPLQSARDRFRRLDLDDEIDGAHVDPELERGRCDEAGDLALLQQLLDLDPLLPRERAVVGASDRRSGELVGAAGRARSARRRLLTKTIVERCGLDKLERAAG